MKVQDPGHAYLLDWLDGPPQDAYLGDPEDPETLIHPTNALRFVKRSGERYPGNQGSYPGTNCQEVLRVLINRVEYLHRQIPDWRNVHILSNLRWSLCMFEERAAERHGRLLGPILLDGIETLPTCPTCGHIQCPGHADIVLKNNVWFDKDET